MLTEAEIHQVRHRRLPCLMTYLAPFRLVLPDGVSWEPTLYDINNRNWDFVLLHTIVTALDVGLPPPFNLVIGMDGSLALPPIDGITVPDHEAAAFFNKCLAALLLGGVYCEAISSDGLDMGTMIDLTYLRVHRYGQAAPNRFHNHIRHQQAAPHEAIALMKPQTIRVDQLTKALQEGLEVLKKVERVSADLLLKGVTGVARRDWSAGLSNLWIVGEQLVSLLWEREMVLPLNDEPSQRNRREQLKDTRTWTMSTRIEMLFQKQVIDGYALANLSLARKARNDLVHNGKQPQRPAARAILAGVEALFKAALPAVSIPLFQLNLDDHSLSDPFTRTGFAGEPQYWMPIQKLPGEDELEKLEAKARQQKTKGLSNET